jgi:predicted Zn-dependent peptidase
MSSNRGIASLAADALARSRPLEAVAAYPRRIAAVNGADVQRVAARYFGDEALRAVVVGNGCAIGDLRSLGIAGVQRRTGYAELAR